MKNNRRTIITSVILAAMIAFSCFMLAGCSFLGSLFGDGASFTVNRLTLRVGESFNASEIIECDSSYVLRSTDSSVLEVSGVAITAKSVGSAGLIVESDANSDRITVTVIEKVQDSFSVQLTGDPIQTVGSLSAVTLTPKATGAAVTENVVWYLNDKYHKTTLNGEKIVFTPSEAGIFTFTAKCGDFQDEVEVRVYHNTEITVDVRGELEQSAPSPIVFGVSGESDPLNPPDYMEVICDDKIVYAGERTEFTFTPEPGKHYVTVNVNGVARYSCDITCRGAVKPSVPTVRYDNVYPHFYVCHDAVGYAQVEITTPRGEKQTFSQHDSRYNGLFGTGAFDAGSYVSVCGAGTGGGAYTIRIKSLGDGDMLDESEYSDSCTFYQLPSAAKPYLATQCLNGDLYVTSDKEYVEVAEYYIYFRDKKAGASVSFDCYIGYNMTCSAEDLWNDAFPIATTSGVYKKISVNKRGQIMSTSFTVSVANAPSRQACDLAGAGAYSRQLHAILPHINYDESNYRRASYVFPIDLCPRSANVYYTDELYLAASCGVTPIPVGGSPAETVYNMARNVMRKICTDDMTDAEKAHAVYDWIMWKVTYDTPATETQNGEAYAAYYLEGVFADGKTAIGGKVYKPYAVCDGMSKAYALMCNIEGIPCVRVVGKAGEGGSLGGHAWNKVKLGDEWYAVDCTWGDAVGNVAVDGGRTVACELGVHDYLFVCDAEISDTHYEPYRLHSSSIVYAPETANENYNIYKYMKYNGAEINCFIAENENTLERAREICTAFAVKYKRMTGVIIPGGENDGYYTISAQGFDIYTEKRVADYSKLTAVIRSAIRTVLPSAEVRSSIYGNKILVTVS